MEEKMPIYIITMLIECFHHYCMLKASVCFFFFFGNYLPLPFRVSYLVFSRLQQLYFLTQMMPKWLQPNVSFFREDARLFHNFSLSEQSLCFDELRGEKACVTSQIFTIFYSTSACQRGFPFSMTLTLSKANLPTREQSGKFSKK